MAVEAGNRAELLPLLQEHEDSGIDSDDTERARAQNGNELVQLTDTSSSDEEPVIKVPRVQCAKRKLDEQLKDMEEGRLECEILIPMIPWQRSCEADSTPLGASPDRSSPPLYEVELTASDEDDDTSVLELVIPLQSARYKKTSTKTEITSLFCNLFCCFRR